MLYDDDTWEKLIESFDSLEFLIPRPTGIERVSKIYHVVKSTLAFELVRDFYTSSRYECYIIYYDIREDDTKEFDFEEFFERLSEELKQKVIFHLDLFR